MMSAEVIPLHPNGPLVSVARRLSAPRSLGGAEDWWGIPSLSKVPGWAVEIYRPDGKVDRAGFFREEATAWQQAQALAARSAWPAIRNSAVALRLAMNGRRP